MLHEKHLTNPLGTATKMRCMSNEYNQCMGCLYAPGSDASSTPLASMHWSGSHLRTEARVILLPQEISVSPVIIITVYFVRNADALPFLSRNNSFSLIFPPGDNEYRRLAVTTERSNSHIDDVASKSLATIILPTESCSQDELKKKIYVRPSRA